MGLRPALVVGITGLVLVILGTFIFMAVLKIDLQRMSLGTLVIDVGRDHVWTHAGNDGASADGVLCTQRHVAQAAEEEMNPSLAMRCNNNQRGPRREP